MMDGCMGEESAYFHGRESLDVSLQLPVERGLVVNARERLNYFTERTGGEFHKELKAIVRTLDDALGQKVV